MIGADFAERLVLGERAANQTFFNNYNPQGPIEAPVLFFYSSVLIEEVQGVFFFLYEQQKIVFCLYTCSHCRQ